jgi:hypothetical protein
MAAIPASTAKSRINGNILFFMVALPFPGAATKFFRVVMSPSWWQQFRFERFIGFDTLSK